MNIDSFFTTSFSSEFFLWRFLFRYLIIIKNSNIFYNEIRDDEQIKYFIRITRCSSKMNSINLQNGACKMLLREFGICQ